MHSIESYEEPGLETIQRLLHHRGRFSPDAPCLLASGRETLSYSRLWEQCRYVGNTLGAAGLGRESRVAAVLPTGVEAAAALLCFTANCAYAPLNPDETASAFKRTFTELSPAAVLVLDGYYTAAQQVAQTAGVPILVLSPALSEEAGRFRLHMPSMGQPMPYAAPSRDTLALFLETSGTAGGSKLVMHTHRTALTGARFLANCFQLSERDRAINIAPLFHSLATTGTVLATVVSGGSIICAPGSDPQLFFEWMDELSPTWFGAVPSMLQAILLRAPEFEHVIRRRPLRFFRSVAAPLPRGLADGLEEIFHAPMIQVYGLSEASGVTAEPLPPGRRKPGSVGVPVGPEVSILDDRMERLSAGESGQVAVRGENVAAGYWNNPRATDQIFRDGWLLTGDCGYFDADGYLYITGRIQEFINRGGEKICPAEVDEVFHAHPHVAQAFTFAIPDERLGEEVGIAIVPRHPGAVTAGELQRFAASRLAFHKIPRQVFFLDKLPLGASGKPSRRRVLEGLAAKTTPPAAIHVAPRNSMEKALARLWSAELRVPEPGIHDHFFDSGGDSLNAVCFLTCVSRELKTDALPIGLLMEAPTIAELAILLSDSHSPLGSGVVALQPQGSRIPLFLIGTRTETRQLAKALDRDQPVFAIPIPALEDLSPPHTIEAAADFCLDVLRQFRPNGPYLLAGWCSYGVIAYEIACRLVADGHQVPLVALIEARDVLSTSVTRPTTGDKIRFHFRRLRNLPPALAAPYAFERMRTILRSFAKTLWWIAYARCREVGKPLPAALRNRSYALRAARRLYQPRPYSGRVAHFLALDRQSGDLSQLKMEWSHLIQGPVTFHEVPGDHSTIWDPPNVFTMARILARQLS